MISHLKSEQELHDYIGNLYERLPYYLKAKNNYHGQEDCKILVDEINLLLT